MKKVLIGLLVFVIILSASAFILIPKELKVSKVLLMQTNENALFRYLSNSNKWQRWWPDEDTLLAKKNVYLYNGFRYEISKVLYNAVEVNMSNEARDYPGRIVIIPMSYDSVAVKWESTFTTSANPVIRFLIYRKAKAIRKNMEVILDSLKAFSENSASVYDYNIHRTTIKDTFLVAIKTSTTGYPSTTVIYGLVADLKKYINRQGAKETNYPMLNVTTYDSVHYTTMVAVPTDKKLVDKGNISFKQMVIYKDKTVTAEVKGGAAAIQKAYRQLDTYLNDYNLSTPVIHWESLVTDRSKETDSAKWVTKIFMPIV